MRILRGVCSAALRTTVLPHASAGPNFHLRVFSFGHNIACEFDSRRHGERVVPRDDLADDSNRLSDSIRKLVRDADGLTKDLVAPTAVVTDNSNCFNEVVGQSLGVRLACNAIW